MENTNSQTPEKKKGKKKWIIIAVIIVLIITIVGSGSSEPTVDTPSTDNSVSQSTKENETTKSATDEIKSGSTVSNNSVKISYKSCNTDFTDYSPYADVKNGYRIIEAVFDFENISNSDIFVDGFECYADGAKCESFFYVDDYTFPYESISSGRKLTDVAVYYQVPTDAERIELEYEADFWDDEKYVFIVE